MGAFLDKPLIERAEHREGTEKLDAAMTSIQGWRVHQEVSGDGCKAFVQSRGLPEPSLELSEVVPGGADSGCGIRNPG